MAGLCAEIIRHLLVQPREQGRSIPELSIGLDLKILLDTIPAVLSRVGTE